MRAHLCNHSDVNLQPRQRDHTSAVVHDASAEDHALAYLEHHRHGIEIIRFFLTYEGTMREAARIGFRIVVHSRFDETVDPFLDAPTLCFDPTLQFPHIDLRLYNHTGNCVSGFHYDPVFLNVPPSRASGQSAKKRKMRTSTTISRDVAMGKSKSKSSIIQQQKDHCQPTYLQLQGEKTAKQIEVDTKPSVLKVDDVENEDKLEVLDHFIVRPMSSKDTPDQVRAQLDTALENLALMIRPFPTLPADPQNPTHHLAETNSPDCALELPPAHCAFSGCAWTGACHAELLSHLEDQHLNVMQPSIEALQEKISGGKNLTTYY